VKAADLAPRFLLPSFSTLLGSRLRGREIRSVTGLTETQWRDLGRAFPRLGADPGRPAARARRRFGFLVGRALAHRRRGPAFRDAPPPEEPTLYTTGHLGDLRGLRYLLRRHIAIGNVARVREAERAAIVPEDRLCDERDPRDFPHVFYFRQPHRLRSALQRGSLLVAADLPEREGVDFPILGGRLLLDPRPFRLARLAGVPCRAVFLTAPAGRLTITIGPVLPREEEAALPAFARQFESAADESPFDIDAPTWWNRLAPQ
jgi:hypothetical protein